MILHGKVIMGQGQLRANEINFGMKHVPGAGLIIRPVDLKSKTIPLGYDYPRFFAHMVKDTSQTPQETPSANSMLGSPQMIHIRNCDFSLQNKKD